MPEEQQKEYLEEKTGSKRNRVAQSCIDTERNDDVSMARENKDGFHMIDKKIQDMLRSKKLARLVSPSFYIFKEDYLHRRNLGGKKFL